jgi:hypothetical protein
MMAEGTLIRGDRAFVHMARDPRKARFFPPTAEGIRRAFEHLESEHGIDPVDASDRLHAIKEKMGFGGEDNVAVDRTGNVYSPIGLDDPATRELLGSLTEGGKKRRHKS